MRIRTVATQLALLASVPLALSQDSVSYDFDTYGVGDDSGTPYQTYQSNAVVQPPEMHINRNGTALADGYIFVGVNGKPTSGQNWPTIFEFSDDIEGSLIWTANYSLPFDFRTQTYKGEPVLTFWSGIVLNGYGRGSFYMLNQSYDEIAHFEVARFGDDMGDAHEFTVTPDDTALVAIYIAVPYDLSAVGGSEDGWLFENTFQEINIETGELVFEWNASTHVGLNESYNALTDVGESEEAPWDYFHINSVAKDKNGDYLVSGRHDARWLNDDMKRITVFDNGPTEDIGYSRGLLLDVNEDDMTVTLVQDFTNEAKTFAQYEGSLRAIDPSNETTNYIIGYGNQPFFTELDYQGNILLDVQFGKTNVVNAYRAFRQPWEGKPSTKPDIHWDKDGNSTYFSWNGATEVASWVVCTANASDSDLWTNVTVARRTGFETTIDLSDVQLERFVRGKAVNSNGTALGWTMASDGDELYDAPDNVSERGSASATPTPSSTSSSSPSGTNEASSTTLSGAAARATHAVMEQAYVVAVVVVGGLAFV
ncbi:hypothetical protein BDW02DRAFT_503134 [Decorospora gaudefroyi]|uniref:ASST-domain-containing protein n=1 Tax=Decorospora gaudefroyi TaxID=184978 RepID=A0A6A5K557_9PLEO|nr:hypothetical protein BDW02DRAFT_503134 [Decorospora gaudefroyi]